MLMLADVCPNVYVDTSSSNRWLRYLPHLTLRDAFRATLEVMGSQRLLFGTDSSFFPRGWQPAVLEAQRRAMADAGATDQQMADVEGDNFERLFPVA